MKRVWRYLFNGLTILSLLLCAAASVLWVRSYWVTDRLVLREPTRAWQGLLPGSIAYGEGGELLVSTDGGVMVLPYGGQDPADGRYLITGVQGFFLPYIVPAIAGAIVPLLRVITPLLRRRRPARGLCPACGYDLRATPDRCPECGAGATTAVNG